MPEKFKSCKKEIIKFHNLAEFDISNNNTVGAIEKYEKIIRIDENNTQALNNLANIQFKDGKVAEALQLLKKAITVSPQNFSIKSNLLEVLIFNDEYNNINTNYFKIDDSCNDDQALKINTQILILKYLNGEIDEVYKYLGKCKNSILIKKLNEITKNYIFSRSYFNLISKLILLNNCRNSKDQKIDTIYAIGDSHSLGMNNTTVSINGDAYLIKTKLIPGCKQYHLGNGSANKYKYSVSKSLSKLRNTDKVLLFIGEIDTRHDEGVIKASLKNNIDLIKLTKLTIINYIDYLVELNYNLQIIIVGIPKPSENRIKILKLDKNYIKFVKIFNDILMKYSLKSNFSFLDIYSMSEKYTESGEDFFIDDLHYDPIKVCQLFEKFLIKNNCSLRNENLKKFIHISFESSDITNTSLALFKWYQKPFDIAQFKKMESVEIIDKITSITTGSMDAVLTSKYIEHLYPHEVPVALTEFLRILKPDGFVVIICPDLQAVCALVADGKLIDPTYVSPAGPITPLDILYGNRTAMSDGKLYMAHHCGFTEKVLIETLKNSGFKRVATMKRGAPYYDLWALATKADLNEVELLTLAKTHFTTK
jgi:tetratricopeptide (TPR) repeat protein